MLHVVVYRDITRTKVTARGASESSSLFLAILLGAVLLLLLHLWDVGQQQRALIQMSPEARARVYLGAISTMKEMCPPQAHREEAFEERCREQADFLAKFPECDEACRELVRSNLSQPTR